jgi:hypothetical protein
MFSILILLIPPRFPVAISILPFILRSDGECSDPYDGIRRIGLKRVSRVFVSFVHGVDRVSNNQYVNVA